MENEKLARELEECQKTVEDLEEEKTHLVEEKTHLKEENRHLRQAAGAFGQLAERLNVTLREERRRQAEDRRTNQRATPDRRGGVAANDPKGPRNEDW